MYTLDEMEAFRAAMLFLDRYYRETDGKGEVAVILSDMQIQPDGMTNDPAAWDDWLGCVRKVKEGN